MSQRIVAPRKMMLPTGMRLLGLDSRSPTIISHIFELNYSTLDLALALGRSWRNGLNTSDNLITHYLPSVVTRVGRRLKLFADSTTLLRDTGGNALLHISMLAVTVGEILMGGLASVDFRPKILDEES